jgi:hypothetical protein
MTVSDNIIKVQVSDGIKNPPSAMSLSFSLNIHNSSFEIKDYNDNINIVFTPGNLSNTNISSSTNNCGEIANLTFSFLANQSISKGGFIKIILPSFTQDSGYNLIQSLITANTALRVNNVFIFL